MSISRTTVAYLAVALLLAPFADAYAASFPVQQLNATFRRSAQELPGPVYRYSWPRTDVKLKVAGTAVSSKLALGSWAAFTSVSDKSWVMGDLVLLQSEVAPVIEKLGDGGVSITAIHNHLMDETPRVVYVHYMGEGDPVGTAKTLEAALRRTRTPMGSEAKPARQMRQPAPKWVSQLEGALGRKGKLTGQVYSVSALRADEVRMNGQVVPAAMGLATGMNFEQIGSEVASTGDFVMTAGEVNPVLRALQRHGITATALHNHMLDDSPHMFFLHYWALGSPEEVGAGLKAALTRMNVKQ